MKALLPLQNDVNIREASISEDDEIKSCEKTSYDGAEVFELVGLFILNELCNEYGKDNICLYRDDGLAIFKHTSGPQAERIRKDFPW